MCGENLLPELWQHSTPFYLNLTNFYKIVKLLHRKYVVFDN